MDPRRFDLVVQSLATVASRRGALGGLTGGLLALAATAVGWDAIEAKGKKKRKKKKKRRKKRQQGLIVAPPVLPPPPPPTGGCTTASQCPRPTSACLMATCKNGQCGTQNVDCGANKMCRPDDGCVCQDGFDSCGADCFQAGAACNTGLLGQCAMGTLSCQGTDILCVADHTPVVETCNGLDDDCDGVTDNDAVCPNRPHSSPLGCSGGKCHYFCSFGWKDCDGDPDNGCETNVGSDPQNCGDCGSTCGGNQTCSGGLCADPI